MKTLIINISKEKIWAATYKLKESNPVMLASGICNVEEGLVSDDGVVCDVPSVAVLINNLMKINRIGSTYGMNAILMFHTANGSVREEYNDEFKKPSSPVNVLKVRDKLLISDINEDSYSRVKEVAKLLAFNTVFIGDYNSREFLTPFSAEEAYEMFGGWKTGKYDAIAKEGKSADIIFVAFAAAVITFFSAAMFWSYKEYKKSDKPINEVVTETEITEIPCTLVATDTVGSAKYENYYIYLEDRNGDVRQFSVNSSDYSAINFKYKLNDSVTVTDKGGLYYLDECYLSMGRTVSNNKETNLS
jgi:hypothetical protein